MELIVARRFAKSRDLLGALCVLALMFLNFGHAPAAALAQPTLTQIAADSFCGDPVHDHQQAHAPCHACRIGGSADLPPVCRFAIPAFAMTSVRFAAPAEPVPMAPLLGYFEARAPPQA